MTNREWKPHTRHRERKKIEVNPPTGLVLTRRIGESILIGDNIRITVVDVVGERVELCFDAPKEIAIDREEIRKRKQALK